MQIEFRTNQRGQVGLSVCNPTGDCSNCIYLKRTDIEPEHAMYCCECGTEECTSYEGTFGVQVCFKPLYRYDWKLGKPVAVVKA